jgi:hypothetical protein
MLRIETPDIKPVRGGLLSLANVITGTDVHAYVDGVIYQDSLHGPARMVPTDGSEKVFDRPDDVVKGEPFSIYRGVETDLFRRDIAAGLVERLFGAGETRAVEEGLRTLILDPNAVDLTPTAGTAVSPKEALGILEQHASDNYNGLPMLHVSRYGAAFLAGEMQVDKDNWTLHTKQGTPVVNGGGYHGGGPAAAGAGQFWLYATGQVNLWQSPVSAATEGLDVRHNVAQVLVERTYIPTVERFVAAVLVTAP